MDVEVLEEYGRKKANETIKALLGAELTSAKLWEFLCLYSGVSAEVSRDVVLLHDINPRAYALLYGPYSDTAKDSLWEELQSVTTPEQLNFIRNITTTMLFLTDLHEELVSALGDNFHVFTDDYQDAVDALQCSGASEDELNRFMECYFQHFWTTVANCSGAAKDFSTLH